MYVCNCQGVRESELARTIRTGVTSLRALRELLGVGSGCGKCVCDVRERIRAELAEGGCTDCGRCRDSAGERRVGSQVAPLPC